MASKTSADPSGQRDNRARTTRRFNTRLNRAEREVITLFRDIPRNRVIPVVNQTYEYDLTPEQLEIFNSEIRRILDQELETEGNSVPLKWWYKPEVELPTRQGTLEELNEFNHLIAVAAGLGLTVFGGLDPQRVAPEVVLSSQKYLSELRNVYAENFQLIKDLSNKTAGQIIRIINDEVQAGSTPAKVADEIRYRFDVSKSSAERIARTEINRAYNDAKLRAGKTASELSGFKSKVRHISALLPKRTRRHHAARHFKVYTAEDQIRWWNTGANRINCLCTIRTVLIDDQGNYIES